MGDVLSFPALQAEPTEPHELPISKRYLLAIRDSQRDGSPLFSTRAQELAVAYLETLEGM